MRLKEWGMFGLLGLIWGSSFLWIKVAMGAATSPLFGLSVVPGGGFSPFVLVGFRLLFGWVGMLIVALLRRAAMPRDPRVYAGFAVMGIVYGAMPFGLITWAETRIDSGLAAILNGTVPLFTIVIAHFWLRDEKMSAARAIGLAVGFAGVSLLGSRDTAAWQRGGNLLGQAAVIAAAICYAAASTFSRRYLRGQSPIAQSLVTLVVADSAIFALIAATERPIVLPAAPLAWLAAAWLGLLGSCLAYMLYFSLINAWGPTRANLVTYVFPVVGLILGITVLGERADWRLLAGTLLVVSGIVAANIDALRAAARRE